MRTTDQPEPFQPLGRPIRDERAPEPIPVPVAPGIVRDPDGTLRTIMPPPSAPAPALRPMQTRDKGVSVTITHFLCADKTKIESRVDCLFDVEVSIRPSRREWNEARNIALTQLLHKIADLPADGDVTYTSNIPRHEHTGC